MRPRLALLLALVLAACQTAPAPEDSFYRLLPVVIAPELPPPVRQGGVAVEVLRADSLYSERPVVYADAAYPRLLKQYHYHLWLYPPGQLVQAQLVASLRRSNPGAAIVQGERAGAARYRVTGRVLRFERVVAPDGATAVAELELALEPGDGAAPFLRKTYSAEAAAPTASVGAFGEAMERALERIYSAFAADIHGMVRQGTSEQVPRLPEDLFRGPLESSGSRGARSEVPRHRLRRDPAERPAARVPGAPGSDAVRHDFSLTIPDSWRT